MTQQPARPAEAAVSREPEPFSITQGPFLRGLRRLGLTRADGSLHAWRLVAIAWGPLALGVLVHAAGGIQVAPLVRDLSVHIRLLIGIPLLVQAERVLEQRCRSAVEQLRAGRFAERAALDRILDRAGRLRESRSILLVLVALAVLGGQALLWGVSSLTGPFAGIAERGEVSLSSLWYVFVAWPIAQILVLRWLWNWAIWSYVTVRLSRLPLATIATHPDRAAGLGFLREPVNGFAGFVLALSALLASGWLTRVLAQHVRLQSFVPEFVAFVVLAAIVACGPLLLFIRMLYRARHREIDRYNGLALDYVRAFHRKWIEERPEGSELLGSSDLQSLNDLCGAYEHLEQSRLVPFGPRTLIGLAIAAVVPMLPLVAASMPLDELLRQLVHVLLGTLPGVG